MPERVVVTFRGANAHDARHKDRALALKQRAEALGATLCSWSAQCFSFDFGTDELEEALSLVAAASEIDGGEPFAVGIAQGALEPIGEAGALAVLAWGRPLVTAVSLSRVARAGEVLVDPELPAVRSGELLVAAPRVAADAGRRVRGLILDAAQPFRRFAAREVARLVDPPFILAEHSLDRLDLPVGTLATVLAEPGAGGTRLLSEATRRLQPSRALAVAPVGSSREPLGAVRRALARSAAREGAPALPERLREALERLLAGEGADPWSVAELVDTWLAPEGGRFGVLTVDDASEIDAASLEAVTNALHVRAGFRLVARLDPSMPMPDVLGAIPHALAIELPALTRDRAERLVAGFAGGAISVEAVQRWARRGVSSPLAVREALVEAITSGELAFVEGVARPRRRSAGRGGAAPARRWIERRLRFCPPEERAAVTALALLGGDAPDAMVAALAGELAGKKATSLEPLLESAWATRPEPGWVQLRSRTAREAIAAAVDASERERWHAVAAEVVAQHGGPLARADAAHHASLAGQRRRAAELAIEAARTAARAGLEAAATALLAFAHEHDPALTEAAAATPVKSPKGTLPPVPSRRSGLDGVEEGALPLRSDPPPRERFDTLVDDTVFAQFDPSRAPSVPPRAPAPPPVDAKPAVVPAPKPDVPEVLDDADVLEDDDPRVVADALAERAKEALVQGDVETLAELIQSLRVTGEHAELVERMTGLVALGRGAKDEALRRLRAATEGDILPARRARALLAYGVALAAAGRNEAALLEALSALARAREAGDAHGEHACARFLARLSAACGHSAAASAWAKVAKRALSPQG